MLFISSVIGFFMAVFIIMMTIFQEEDEYKASEKLDDNVSKSEIARHGVILRYSRPFFKRYVSPVVARMKGKDKYKDLYKRKLASAGLTDILKPEDFFAFKLFLIIGFPVLYVFLSEFSQANWPYEYIPFIGIGGFFYPDIWLRGKIQARQKNVIMAMPFVVDMLALSVEAGLDFVAAMHKVIEKAKPSALSDEFIIFLREVKVGAARADGLRNMAWRINLLQVSSFCATLIAADSVGASIGPILKSLSVEMRQKRSSEVEKAGATAATKILFPMMFLIIPAVFLVVGVPLALEMFFGEK